MPAPPAWAQTLTAKVLADRGQYHGVHMTWRRRTGEFSSGTTWSERRRIAIRSGSSRKDAKLVVLHELAHIITGHTHTPEFWDCAWELYRDYGVNLVYAQKREFTYKAEARRAYKRIIGKRALRIKVSQRHRHKWEESKREEFSTYHNIHQTCTAIWYDSGQACGAWRMRRELVA